MKKFSMDISPVCQDLTVQPLPPPFLPLPHLHHPRPHHPRLPHLQLTHLVVALDLMVALDIQNLSDIRVLCGRRDIKVFEHTLINYICNLNKNISISKRLVD